ncbi:Aldo-keto reductase family 4 member C9, partial [Tetrabaena socialis]
MNLTEAELVVLPRPGAPRCGDDAPGCAALEPAACAAGPLPVVGACKIYRCGDDAPGCTALEPAACAAGPLPVVGACKVGASCPLLEGPGRATEAPPPCTQATCGACSADAADAAAAAGGADDECFDAVDMCAWWASQPPRVCERAAADLQRWWWVAAACRRTCGLCGGAAAGAQQGEASGSHSADGAAAAAEAAAAAAAALVAAARFGVQVGEGPDGTPRVAVYEPLPSDPSTCADKQDQCGAWKAAGECARNPGFMAQSCPASCGSCPVLLNLPRPLARVRLNNGVLMPTVGYGCAGLGDLTAQTVRWALDAGFRHLDSAQAREWYREDLVGQALAGFLGAASGAEAPAAAERLGAQQGGGAAGGRSLLAAGAGATDGGSVVMDARRGAGGSSAPGGAVRRKHLFLTSKLHPRHLGYETTLRQFNASLQDLRTPYVDLFLLHYSECWGDLCGGVKPEGTFLDSWRALEELYEAGLVRAIGVSNFSPDQLLRLLAAARVRPAVLQIHVDPLDRGEATQELCRREGLTLTAYSTLGTQWGGGSNPVLGHPVLQGIGREAGGRSAAQVALRWALQQGLVVLPRSSNQGRIAQNLRLYDWGVSAAHMGQVAHLRRA